MVTNDTYKRNTIFIVDDIPENIDLLIGYLRGQNFEIVVAKNAINFFNQIALVKPNIVLLDIMMPDINGFEACQWLKERDEYKDIPVIFMSALSETVDKVKGLSLGAIDYITKPIEQAELLARINVHMELKAAKDIIAEKNLKLLQRNENLEKINNDLIKALDEIKTLKSVLPICSNCNKIRGDNLDPKVQKSWISFPKYITDNFNTDFTHGICPECIKKLYPEAWLTIYAPSKKT